MHRATLSAMLSHWLRHPLQLGSLLLGLALATALWSGVQAINAEARASYARAAQMLGQDRFAQLVPRDGQRFDQSLYVALRRAGWQVSPVLEGELRLGEQRLRVLGIDPLTAPVGAVPQTATQGDDLPGFLTTPGQGYAAPQTVKALEGQAGLPALIASDAVLPGMLITDIGIAQVYQTEDGLLIAALVPDGAAEKAGLRGPKIIREESQRSVFGKSVKVYVDRSAADMIVGIDDQPIETAEDFITEIENRAPNSKATINIIREGRPMKVVVTLSAGE